MADASGRDIVGQANSARTVSPFLSLLRAGDRALQTELQRSSAIQHATTKGSVRERALKPLARQLFPRRFEVTSGEIMNATGDRSRAQDLIIYDPNVVAGWQVDEADALVPTEAVVATIEVKSGAARTDVERASTNLASVKSVFGHRPRSGLAGDLLIDDTAARPLGIAIFYGRRHHACSYLPHLQSRSDVGLTGPQRVGLRTRPTIRNRPQDDAATPVEGLGTGRSRRTFTSGRTPVDVVMETDEVFQGHGHCSRSRC